MLSIRLMCFIIWFCQLIRVFPFWFFLGDQYFCDFTFFKRSIQNKVSFQYYLKLYMCLQRRFRKLWVTRGTKSAVVVHKTCNATWTKQDKTRVSYLEIEEYWIVYTNKGIGFQLWSNKWSYKNRYNKQIIVLVNIIFLFQINILKTNSCNLLEDRKAI